MSKRIWLSPPHQSGQELKYIMEALESNFLAPQGPNVDAFEQSLCEYTGRTYAAALSSGTAALHLALKILDVGLGDIVICQTFTFIATANPIVYLGAIPVFIDSENLTWNMCPNALEDAIKYYVSKRKKPKAIIGVHSYGMPAQLDDILFICQKYDIPFVEDAAEALGSAYKGKKAGSFGVLSILSFNGNKIITTSAGGALLSDNESMINKAKFLATQAKDPVPHYQHSEIGYNYRMSNVCAGIGRAQMEVIDQRVKQRRKNFEFYKKELKSLPGIAFQNDNPDSVSNRWLSCVLLDQTGSNDVDWENVRMFLETKNIESRPLWKPLHLQPVFKDAPYFGGGAASKLFDEGLCLPSGSDLPDKDLFKITTNIKKALHGS